MNEQKRAKIKINLLAIFKEMESGERFYGWQLYDRLVKRCPSLKQTYIETVLRQMRLYCHGKYKVIQGNISLYEKI